MVSWAVASVAYGGGGILSDRDPTKAEWEMITLGETEETQRLRVPGGWLVRTLICDEGDKAIGVAMVFVQDPTYHWEHWEV